MELLREKYVLVVIRGSTVKEFFIFDNMKIVAILSGQGFTIEKEDDTYHKVIIKSKGFKQIIPEVFDIFSTVYEECSDNLMVELRKYIEELYGC